MNAFDGAFVVLWAAEPDELAPIEKTLSRLGSRIQSVGSLEQLQRLMEEDPVDLVIVALRQSFQSPLDLFSEERQVEKDPPVLVVADLLDVGLYLEAIQRGALDGVGLPLDENELIRIGGRALEARRSQSSRRAA